MSERVKKFEAELDKLISEGDNLRFAMQYDCDPDGFKAQIGRIFKDEQKIGAFLKTLPDFKSKYQTWYSKAQAVIKQVLPDRLADFISHYEFRKERKSISFQNYMIRDYLQGLRVTTGGGYEVLADGSAAIPEFVQQLNLIKAAKDTLSSTLMDFKAVLQADLFDTEIETAAALAKAGYFRAAGAICGVVIEKHLLHVCDVHKIKPKKKNSGISELSQELKDGAVITIPQWRFIQHLADIRNICDHAKGREPTKNEIDDLVTGSEKLLRTVY